MECFQIIKIFVASTCAHKPNKGNCHFDSLIHQRKQIQHRMKLNIFNCLFINLQCAAARVANLYWGNKNKYLGQQKQITATTHPPVS